MKYKQSEGIHYMKAYNSEFGRNDYKFFYKDSLLFYFDSDKNSNWKVEIELIIKRLNGNRLLPISFIFSEFDHDFIDCNGSTIILSGIENKDILLNLLRG